MFLYASVAFVWLYCTRYFPSFFSFSGCHGFTAAVIVNVWTFHLTFYRQLLIYTYKVGN